MTVLSGLHVLVVDNEPAILEGMRLLLTGLGLRCRGPPPISTRRNRPSRRTRPRPDVIIADYHLDEGDGLDLIKILRWKTRGDDARGPRHGRPHAGGPGCGRGRCTCTSSTSP